MATKHGKEDHSTSMNQKVTRKEFSADTGTPIGNENAGVSLPFRQSAIGTAIMVASGVLKTMEAEKLAG